MSLELYRPLSSNNDAVRVEAAKKLISELSATIGGEHTPQGQKQIDYAVKRLTRGLASGRESARLGFALAFTELVALLIKSDNSTKWNVNFENILEAVQNNTKPEGGASKQEEKDAAFGKLFGIKALAQPEVLQTVEQWDALLSVLLELAAKKPWIREPCASVVAQCVNKFPELDGEERAATTYTKLNESGLAKTSDGVAIWLALQGKYPNVKPPAKVWAHDTPLHNANLTSLAKALKESKSGSEEEGEKKAKQKGNWNPRVPFVWHLIIRIYAEEKNSDFAGLRDKDIADFATWWRVVVDENLFSASASDERKFWGFQLFMEVLKCENSNLYRDVFTKNYMRCLMNQLSDSSRYLHKIAEKSMRSLHKFATENPSEVYQIVESLISGNGTPNFDSITKTKTVEKLLPCSDVKGIEKLVKMFDSIILKPSDSEAKAVEARRQWAADQLLSLVRAGSIQKSDAWLGPLLDIFATYGHFDIPKAKPALSTKTQSVFRSRLMSCLSSLVAPSTPDVTESWPYKAVKRISHLQRKGKYNFAIELDETIDAALSSAYKRLEKIEKKKEGTKGAKRARLIAFDLLFSLVILQVLDGDGDSLGVLDELEYCYEKVMKSKSKGDDGEQDPGDLIVEILLSFLSKQSALLRKLALQVFKSFAPEFTPSNLQILFDVLDTNENEAGQSELFERNDDDEDMDEDGDEEDDEDELDSDVEMIDGDAKEDNEETSDEEDSDDEDEDEDEEDDEEAAKLDAALAEALGTHKVKAGTEDDGDDDDGSDMDDEQMMALDDQLVNIFKHRKAATSKKQDRKEAKEAMINLKSRVLELLEGYVKEQSKNTNALLIILPLLRLVRTTTTKMVSEKAVGVLRSLCKVRELPKLSAEDLDKENMGWALLQAIHQEVQLEASNAHSAACSQASLLLVKLICQVDRENIGLCFQQYTETMTQWALQKSVNIQPAFFTDLVNWTNSTRKTSLAQ